MSDKLKKSIVVQGSVLAMAGIISKIIGFLYRIPMANIMGNTGNGLYSVSYGIYNIALTLSSYSMPLAVSKLLSERLAKKEYKNAYALFNKAMIFAICTGAIACAALFFGAEGLATIYRKPGLDRPLRVLAPTTFIVAVLGTCRGFFQGHKNMVPTAVSQIIEQIINAAVSVIGTYLCVKNVVLPSEKASLGAMGGTMGTLAGALSALIFFLVLLTINRKAFSTDDNESDKRTEEDDVLFKAIFLTVFPIVISQSIYQLGYTMDDLIFGNLMVLKGYDQIFITDLQGVFNTQYNQMINLPTSIATAMAAATLPSVVASFTMKDTNGVNHKIDVVMKMNMLIAIPSAIGLAVLASPIMYTLFPRLGEYHLTAIKLLQFGSLAVVGYALSTVSTSVLQGCDRMNIPVIHSGISLVVHVILVAVLVYFADLGVYGLVIGNVLFPFVVCVLNCRSIKKLVGYKFDLMGTFIKPFISAIVMGIAVLFLYYGMFGVIEATYVSRLLVMLLSICVGGGVYIVMLHLLRTFKREELKQMPIVKKFIK